MSGSEPFAILGAISSVIAIFETSKEIYEATKNAKGLHESFRKTSDNVAIILSTLYQAKMLQERAVKAHGESNDVENKLKIEKESRAVEVIMNLCKTNAEALSCIFETLAPNKNISRIRRYTIVIGNSMPSKKRKVQSLMRETMEGLQLLHTYHSFNAMTTSKQLQAATRHLSPGPSVQGGEPYHQLFRERLRTMHEGSPATPLKQTEHRHPEATKSQEEESVPFDRDSRNLWMNANGTKVMNQIGAQTVHGSQNFTL